MRGLPTCSLALVCTVALRAAASRAHARIWAHSETAGYLRHRALLLASMWAATMLKTAHTISKALRKKENRKMGRGCIPLKVCDVGRTPLVGYCVGATPLGGDPAEVAAVIFSLDEVAHVGCVLLEVW